jgi:hypothetical protein
MIQLYKRTEIDDALWNRCVKQAVNSSVSGYTWYLDIVCENWSALIWNNYQAILPLPVKTKLNIPYILQPLFIKSLNIYSESEVSLELTNAFLDAIPSKIKLIDINLQVNEQLQRNDFIVKSKLFQLLDLTVSYEKISLDYHKSVHRSLTKASKNNLSIVEAVSVKQVIELFKVNVGYKIKQLKAKNYVVLEALMERLGENQSGFSIGVINKDKQLVAAAFCILSEKEISFFNGSSNDEGKHSGAMFFLFDELFKRYATRKVVFDFEGSSIKSINDFNKKFGAKDCVYLQIKKNRLPYLLKKLSRK